MERDDNNTDNSDIAGHDPMLDRSRSTTVHFGYSGHLGPPLSGHYIRLATIVALNIIE